MLRVLVVDDESAYRESLERLLVRQGYAVRTAGGCDEALEIASEFAPELLLIDWMLRDERSGLELAGLLRAQVVGVQTIMMSGYPPSTLRSEASLESVAAFLEKPFDEDDLLREIAALRERAG